LNWYPLSLPAFTADDTTNFVYAPAKNARILRGSIRVCAGRRTPHTCTHRFYVLQTPVHIGLAARRGRRALAWVAFYCIHTHTPAPHTTRTTPPHLCGATGDAARYAHLHCTTCPSMSSPSSAHLHCLPLPHCTSCIAITFDAPFVGPSSFTQTCHLPASVAHFFLPLSLRLCSYSSSIDTGTWACSPEHKLLLPLLTFCLCGILPWRPKDLIEQTLPVVLWRLPPTFSAVACHIFLAA